MSEPSKEQFPHSATRGGSCSSHAPGCILQLLSDGVELHYPVIEQAGQLLYLTHYLLLAALLQLPGVLDEVLVHAFEESLDRGNRRVRYVGRPHHRCVH